MQTKIFVLVIAALGLPYLWVQLAPQSTVTNKTQPSLALFSQKTDELSKKVRALERQLIVLKKDQRPVGYDHIQRLWKELLWLWQKRALSKAKATELYQMLSDIYWMNNPKTTAQRNDVRTDEQKSSSDKDGAQEKLKSIEKEIENIVKTPGMEKGISETHYNRLKKDLDYLASNGVTGLEKYYKIIEERNPYKIVEADKKQQAALAEDAERKKMQENPYYNCPPDTLPPALAADFTDFSAIEKITPPGTLTGDRDVAKGHFWIWTKGTRVPLYVPVDAIFESVTSGPASASDNTIHHTLNFKVKDRCGFKFRFGHITEPDTSLTPGTILPAGSRVAYTIGNITSGNWDIGFYNMLKEGELGKINAFGMHRYGVCLIDYYPSEKKQAYRALFDPNGPKLVCTN